MVDTDFLVVGSGLAGLNAALLLAEQGRVLVLTKKNLGDGATRYAQGGLASVAAGDDSFAAHVDDTVQAGAGLCAQAVVEAIVEAGPRAVERLSRLGVMFDRKDGDFHLTREGGHSRRRVLHAEDMTGREIMRALCEAVVRHPRIEVWPWHLAVDLITARHASPHSSMTAGPNRCLGVYALDAHSQAVQTIRARATLLATGGAGKVYLYTSNPDSATGDGIALAFRAGASIANMEFFQFHPTCLYHPRAKSFLVSEALRGEGGVLRTIAGQPVMAGVHPQGDLAPRDIVARAIDSQMKRSGDDYVTLDMTGLDPAFLVRRFPNIHTACLALGIDMTRVPIPVVPAAHYSCGGVSCTLDGETDLPGLWVAGECACNGLHGANRLASNSLLEAAVCSERAAHAMLGAYVGAAALPEVRAWDPGRATDPDEMVVVSHNWEELRRLMWNYVGIVRSDKRLARAARRIALLEEEIQEYYWDFFLTPDLVELRSLATVARLIVESALWRRESRGLHWNSDVPSALPQWQRPSRLCRGPKGSVSWLS